MKKTRSQTRHRPVANSLLPGAAIWCELQGILASETCNSFKFREASLETGGLVLVCSFWLWISIENPNESKSTPGSFPAALLDDQKHPEAAVSKAVALELQPKPARLHPHHHKSLQHMNRLWATFQLWTHRRRRASFPTGAWFLATFNMSRGSTEEMNLHHGVWLTPHDMVYTSSQKVDSADTSWWLIQ